MVKILITGDFVINKPYRKNQINESVAELFRSADINIVNLEAPITNNRQGINKTGPNLESDTKSTKNILKYLEIDVVTLANNHIYDFGENGVIDTLNFCEKNNIKTVGAGENIGKASETLYLDTDEGRLAIINFAENEWASAKKEKSGANPMHIIDNIHQIKDAKEKSDFVIVVIHGGHEYYNLPSPRMVQQYRFYAEQGADIIVGHHTHCIGGFEIYNGVPIYYSLGNFLFTKNNPNIDWYKGLALEIQLENKEVKTTIHPVKMSEDDFSLNIQSREEKENTFNDIRSLNEIITNEEKLLNSWDNYVDLKSKVYLGYWSLLSFINNKYVKSALRKVGFEQKSKAAKRLLLNLFRCEAHRDLSREVLERYLK